VPGLPSLYLQRLRADTNLPRHCGRQVRQCQCPTSFSITFVGGVSAAKALRKERRVSRITLAGGRNQAGPDRCCRRMSWISAGCAVHSRARQSESLPQSVQCRAWQFSSNLMLKPMVVAPWTVVSLQTGGPQKYEVVGNPGVAASSAYVRALGSPSR
jgi:hypothetical protein